MHVHTCARCTMSPVLVFHTGLLQQRSGECEGRGGRVSAGFVQGYCLVSPSLPLVSPAPLTSPCPSYCSRCPAKFIYPIIVLSRHVSSTVSTVLLCLVPACHHTETLPPALSPSERSATLDIQIPNNVQTKVFFPPQSDLSVFFHLIQLHSSNLL